MKKDNREFPVTAALKYLGRKTNELFESRMQNAARKICERVRFFSRHSS
jgi:hypothetical protein